MSIRNAPTAATNTTAPSGAAWDHVQTTIAAARAANAQWIFANGASVSTETPADDKARAEAARAAMARAKPAGLDRGQSFIKKEAAKRLAKERQEEARMKEELAAARRRGKQPVPPPAAAPAPAPAAPESQSDRSRFLENVAREREMAAKRRGSQGNSVAASSSSAPPPAPAYEDTSKERLMMEVLDRMSTMNEILQMDEVEPEERRRAIVNLEALQAELDRLTI